MVLGDSERRQWLGDGSVGIGHSLYIGPLIRPLAGRDLSISVISERTERIECTVTDLTVFSV
jgi:hypothetical protein